MAELARATGLSGRDRRAASAAERARQSVTRTIKSAGNKIAGHLPELGHHLARHIKTGAYCCYRLDPQVTITWHFTVRDGDLAISSQEGAHSGGGGTPPRPLARKGGRKRHAKERSSPQ